MRFSLSRFLLRPILYALGMSSPNNVRDFEKLEFPPNLQDVTTWKDNLCALYRRLPTSRDGMETLTVLEIKHFKSKAHPQHEYIIAAVMDGSQKRFVHIARTKEKNAPSSHQSPPSPESTDNLTSWANLFSSSSDSLHIFSHNAHDYICAVNGWGKDECLRTVSFHSCPEKPALFDLALASSVVHDNSPLYRLFRNQCYWFADVVVLVLGDVFQGSNTEIHSKDKHRSNGEYGVDDVLAPEDTDPQKLLDDALKGRIGEDCLRGSGKRLGKWFQVPIYWTRQKLVEKVVMHFREVSDHQKSLVCIRSYSIVCSS